MIKHIVIVTDTSMQSPSGHPIVEQHVFPAHKGLMAAYSKYGDMVSKYYDDIRPGEMTIQMVTRYVALEEGL